MPGQKRIKPFALLLLGLLLFSGVGGSVTSGNDIRYSAALAQWEQQGAHTVDGVTYRIAPSDFITDSGAAILTGDEAYGYAEGAVRLSKGDSFEAAVDLPAEGLYTLSFDYYLLTEGVESTEYSVQVNGEYPFFEARRVVLDPLWKSQSEHFPKDRYGNEVMPSQVRAREWQSTFMMDPARLSPEPLKVFLNRGINTIKVTLMNGEVLSGSLAVSVPAEPPAYAQYAARHAGAPEPGPVMLVLEAEKPDYKNDTAINPLSSRDLAATPYETNELLLNTLGGKTWDQSGQAVYYDIEIERAGLYQIAVKYKQPDKPSSRVFRTLTIDHDIPFREAKQYAFDFTNGWKTEVLGDDQGPYLFWLSEGKHRIGIVADASPYDEIMRVLQQALQQAGGINLEVRKLVGNDVDRNRDWVITDYMPTIREDLLAVADALREQYRKAVELNAGNDSGKGLTALRRAVETLEKLAAEPDRIPRRIRELHGGSGSVTQSLSLAMQDFESQPLTLDQIYITGKEPAYPAYGSSWIRSIAEGFKRFLHSFAPRDSSDHAVVLDVWMNRSRNYMELMQRFTDEEFTPRTGIRVNFSLMPDEKRLTLASASGTAPDLALGISNHIPFDLGLRGAAMNLRQFDDFAEAIRPFSPGSLLPLTARDEVYGLPETQDFYVLFYRKDILDALNIPIPDTWDDVIAILPELQRNGMDFYAPIAGGAGTKPLMMTAPFIYQAGGDVYGQDAFESGLDSPASLQGIQLMTDLFKIYGLPMQVPNFFEHFRSGTMPIGISNFQTYVQLQIAAPELAGSWKIAPAPGIRQEDGTVVRWEPGSAQVTMIFKDTKHPQESWAFLKWWLSTETQLRFANQMQTLYGKEFLWHTANTEAFRQQYWPEEDKQVVLEQWKWLREVPRTPGSYLIERELSNIWNKVVFDGENIRSAVEESVEAIDKETVRRMEEFGYMEKGRVVIPYPVTTIEDVIGWMEGQDGNEP